MLESYNITQTRRRQSLKGRKFMQMRLCAHFHQDRVRKAILLLVSIFAGTFYATEILSWVKSGKCCNE